MLILTRRVGQRFIVAPGSAIDPKMTVAELFRQGPIEVCVAAVSGSRVKLNIEADRRLLILREELCDTGPSVPLVKGVIG